MDRRGPAFSGPAGSGRGIGAATGSKTRKPWLPFRFLGHLLFR